MSPSSQLHVGQRPPLHVLHLLSPAEFGGLESVVQGLAVAQQAAGYRVTVGLTVEAGTSGDHPFASPLHDAGIAVHTVKASRRGYLRECLAIEHLCSRLKPDVVHTHGRRTDVVGGAAARRAGLSTIATVHGAIGGDLKSRLYLRLQHLALRRHDAVVAVSRVIADKLHDSGVSPSKITVIRNAWVSTVGPMGRAAAREALQLQVDDRVLGWVGRLSSEKGPNVFVEALEALHDLHVTAAVIGEGPELEALRRLARRIGLADRLRFYGALPAASRLFPAFDCIVLSSHTEGTPMVLLEAMAAGVPIVATRVGGVPDVVTEREALLVSPGDPETLAGAIRQVLEHPEHAAERALLASRRLQAEFGLEAWMSAYHEIYRGLVPR